MYTVEMNRCNCHPETCCCNDWVVVDRDGGAVSSFFDRDDAEMVCDALNEASAFREALIEISTFPRRRFPADIAKEALEKFK